MAHPVNIDLEAQTTAEGPVIAPWEALDLRPYMAESTRSEIGIEQSENVADRPLALAPLPEHDFTQEAGAQHDSAGCPKTSEKEEEPASTMKLSRFEHFPPMNPSHWPVHAILFVAGFLFCPCWWYGAWRKGEDVYEEMHRFRCTAMSISSVAVVVSLLILEVGFRDM
ncbi:hypothetical protein EIP91_005952 [Steccherinum ochraceum]|uniref:Uncharacterized protein n=1 Tax=Steccherinum ochraceum TaxID=92696 RepID=A0A4R0RTT0_9APHY|nr:hypothetical protein EIP91_005952 [Steccherinum ochraceum]